MDREDRQVLGVPRRPHFSWAGKVTMIRREKPRAVMMTAGFSLTIFPPFVSSCLSHWRTLNVSLLSLPFYSHLFSLSLRRRNRSRREPRRSNRDQARLRRRSRRQDFFQRSRQIARGQAEGVRREYPRLRLQGRSPDR